MKKLTNEIWIGVPVKRFSRYRDKIPKREILLRNYRLYNTYSLTHWYIAVRIVTLVVIDKWDTFIIQ